MFRRRENSYPAGNWRGPWTSSLLPSHYIHYTNLIFHNHVHVVQTMSSIIWLPTSLATLHFIDVWWWPRWRCVWRVMLRPVSTRTTHYAVSRCPSSLLIGYWSLDWSWITWSWWHASSYPDVHLASYALLKSLQMETANFKWTSWTHTMIEQVDR